MVEGDSDPESTEGTDSMSLAEVGSTPSSSETVTLGVGATNAIRPDRKLKVSVTYLSDDPKELLYERDPVLSEDYLESVNSRLEDVGLRPLFIRWSDVSAPKRPRRSSLSRRMLRHLSSRA
jgi:hypothetical protein